MEEEYLIPVDFGESNNPPQRNATTTTGGSVASSSRVASATSAPVHVGGGAATSSGRISSANAGPNTGRTLGGSLDELRPRDANEVSGSAAPCGNSFISSPLLWNSDTRQRINSRREFERKMRHRRRRHRAAASPNSSRGFNFDESNHKSGDAETKGTSSVGPLPKALTDLLLQTAMLGVDTTAKLSGPTMELTRNALLPQIVVPLFREMWSQYAPIRAQAWMRVVPTSLRNAGDLLWDTEAGRSLGERAGRLGDDFVEMASSETARQLCVDFTVSLIKLAEGMHTPEVRALLDQCAVGMCRLVDVLASGKAKQVWFDVCDLLWALIEVGSDPAMAAALAEGCAQICFALEREGESLRQRRSEASAAGCGGDSDSAKLKRYMASKRRRVRDRRQAGTYPPGKWVVTERGGKEDFEEALADGLDGYIAGEGEDRRDFEDKLYDGADRTADDDCPLQSVIVPSSSQETIGGDEPKNSETSLPKSTDGDHGVDCDHGTHDRNILNNDGESEITTEIEDLRVGEEPVDSTDSHTQSSASEWHTPNRRSNALAYEQDDEVNCAVSLRNQHVRPDRHPRDDDTLSEMYDTVDESILQFYRRFNEVLADTRKQSKLDSHAPVRKGNPFMEEGKFEDDTEEGKFGNDRNSTPVSAVKIWSFPTPMLILKGLFGIRNKWWKLFVAASVFGVAAMCMLWFALGCYGFYVIFLGGGHPSPFPSLPMSLSQPKPNIVIQIQTAKSQEMIQECRAKSCGEACIHENDDIASFNLGEWNNLKTGVNVIIQQTAGMKTHQDS